MDSSGDSESSAVEMLQQFICGSNGIGSTTLLKVLLGGVIFSLQGYHMDIHGYRGLDITYILRYLNSGRNL